MWRFFLGLQGLGVCAQSVLLIGQVVLLACCAKRAHPANFESQIANHCIVIHFANIWWGLDKIGMSNTKNCVLQTNSSSMTSTYEIVLFSAAVLFQADFIRHLRSFIYCLSSWFHYKVSEVRASYVIACFFG